MKGNPFLKVSILSLACLGMMLPQGSILAAGKGPNAKSFVNGTSTVDVALGKNGTFVGYVLDSQGKPVDGAAVTIRQGKNDLVKTTTNAKGQFGVKNMKSGQYQVVAGKGARNFRLWSETTAPPKSLKRALLVSDNKVVRGQPVVGGIDIITGTLLVTSTTGMVFAIINNSDIDDLQGDVTMLKNQVTDLETDIDDIQDQLDDIQDQLDEIEDLVTP